MQWIKMILLEWHDIDVMLSSYCGSVKRLEPLTLSLTDHRPEYHSIDQYSPQKTYPKKPYHIRCFPIIMIKILKCSQNNISFLQYWLILWVNWNSTMQKLSAEMRSLICGVELSMCQNSLGRVLFSRIFLHCFIWNTVVSLNWEAFLLFCSSNLFQCTTNFDEC